MEKLAYRAREEASSCGNLREKVMELQRRFESIDEEEAVNAGHVFRQTERKRCTPAHWGLENRRMEYSKSRCQNSDLGKKIKCFPT